MNDEKRGHMRHIDRITQHLATARKPLSAREIANATGLTPGQVSKCIHAYAETAGIVSASGSSRPRTWSMVGVLPPHEALDDPEDLDTVREWRASQKAANAKKRPLAQRVIDAAKIARIAVDVLRGEL